MPTPSYHSTPPTNQKNRFALIICSIIAASFCIATPIVTVFIPDKDSGASANYDKLAFIFIAQFVCPVVALLGLILALAANFTSRNASNRSTTSASIALFLNIVVLGASILFLLRLMFY